MPEYWSPAEVARWGRHQRVLSGGRTITQQAEQEDARHDRGDEDRPRRAAPSAKPLVTEDDGDEPDGARAVPQTREERLASFRAMAARFGVPVEYRGAIKAALGRGARPDAAREAGVQAWFHAQDT